jgi:hypothetical protein
MAKLSAQEPVRVRAEHVFASKPNALTPISDSDSGQFPDYLLNTVGAVLWFPEGTSGPSPLGQSRREPSRKARSRWAFRRTAPRSWQRRLW